MKNIKAGFMVKIRGDADYRADTRVVRTFRKSVVAAVVVAVLLLSTVGFSIAVGFDPMSAWQNLFGRDTAIEINEQVTSAGISMSVQSLYTDGERALLRLTLKDLEGDRLSGEVRLASFYHRFWMYIVDSHYELETGKLTCIVFIEFYENYKDITEEDAFPYTVTTIFTDIGITDRYNPLDFDLYEAAINSNLLPAVSDDEWAASARANPVDTIYYPVYFREIEGVYVDSKGLDIIPQKWLPLDTSVQGAELIHWLSVLRVGYVDGYIHVQMRYNDMMGTLYQYNFDNPVLIDNEGRIIKPASEELDGLFIPGEILYCGYHEQRFYVGDIENLKELRLAWSGHYAEHTITGDWSVEVDLTAINDESISDSIELSDHQYFTEASFSLSPMYIETEMLAIIEYPKDAFNNLVYDDLSTWNQIVEWRDKVNEIHATQEILIILHDGTRIKLEKVDPFDYMHWPMRAAHEKYDLSTGNTRLVTWHILDGSFDVDDVAELIIYGVSFRLAQ